MRKAKMKIQFVPLGGISHPSLSCLKLFLKVAKSCARGFTGREMRTGADWQFAQQVKATCGYIATKKLVEII